MDLPSRGVNLKNYWGWPSRKCGLTFLGAKIQNGRRTQYWKVHFYNLGYFSNQYVSGRFFGRGIHCCYCFYDLTSFWPQIQDGGHPAGSKSSQVWLVFMLPPILMKTYILGFLGPENSYLVSVSRFRLIITKKSKMAATHGFCQLDEGLGWLELCRAVFFSSYIFMKRTCSYVWFIHLILMCICNP